jgi:cytidine deaminase
VLSEFNLGLRVIFLDRGQLKMTTLAQLLPEAFTPQALNDATTTHVRGMR